MLASEFEPKLGFKPNSLPGRAELFGRSDVELDSELSGLLVELSSLIGLGSPKRVPKFEPKSEPKFGSRFAKTNPIRLVRMRQVVMKAIFGVTKLVQNILQLPGCLIFSCCPSMVGFLVLFPIKTFYLIISTMEIQ